MIVRGVARARLDMLAVAAGITATAAATAAGAIPVTLARVFLIFLEIGSVLYGSGYVLLAFLRSDFVLRLGWLTDRQLLDAVAIGQFTPGPVFTTATFVGYVLAGVPGAALATAGIFLPAFVFVAASTPLIPRLRRSPAAIIDPLTAALAVAALLILMRFKMNSAWLVLGGALVGLVARMLGGAP